MSVIWTGHDYERNVCLKYIYIYIYIYKFVCIFLIEAKIKLEMNTF